MAAIQLASRVARLHPRSNHRQRRPSRRVTHPNPVSESPPRSSALPATTTRFRAFPLPTPLFRSRNSPKMKTKKKRLLPTSKTHTSPSRLNRWHRLIRSHRSLAQLSRPLLGTVLRCPPPTARRAVHRLVPLHQAVCLPIRATRTTGSHRAQTNPIPTPQLIPLQLPTAVRDPCPGSIRMARSTQRAKSRSMMPTADPSASLTRTS